MNSDTLKKLGISTFVIILVVAYAIYQKEGSDNKSSTPITAATTPVVQTTSPTQSSNQQTTTTTTTYKDGSYTGSRADAFYGFIQVKTTISGGKITDVTFLEHPTDERESQDINNQAMPLLKSEAIQAQGANVNGVSGATDTSKAFVESLNNALNQAKA